MFLLEVIVVAFATAIVGSLISLGIMYMQPSFTIKKYTFFPQVFLSFFLTGAILHVLFEISGGNRWYCINGNACKS
jgi:ascorbate-specific PTS system EIIC-type component UlaA